MTTQSSCSCFIVPNKVLRHFGDLDSALLSERLRGQRLAGRMALAAVPAGEKRRTIYDAKGAQRLPGARVRGEGDKESTDRSVNAAYDNAGTTYDFYMEMFRR